MLYWTCPEGSQGTATVAFSSNQYPTCANGQGQWVEVPTYTPWWAYEIPGEEVGPLIAAMILFAVVLWVGEYVGWGIHNRK